jgi:hypothetical protein
LKENRFHCKQAKTTRQLELSKQVSETEIKTKQLIDAKYVTDVKVLDANFS